jgi:hypothetical protein
MTTRERWTIYPLVFLALGLSMRAVLVPHGEFETARVGRLEADVVEAGRVICRELVEEQEFPAADSRSVESQSLEDDERVHNLGPGQSAQERSDDAAIPGADADAGGPAGLRP